MPKGIASPHFRNGRHSKYLPTRLLERYAAFVTDDNILELNGEIALLDSRIAELVERVDRGESGELWERLGSAWASFLEASRAKKGSETAVALAVVGDTINNGVADAHAWHEIATLVNHRRRLVAEERKRRLDMEQMLSAQEAMSFVQAVVQAVKENVTDPKALVAISARLAELGNKQS